MKIFLIIAYILLITLICQAQTGNTKHLDQKNGFEGISFGEKIGTLQGKYIAQKDSAMPDRYGVRFYSVSDSALLKLGNRIKLDSISISTISGRIYEINLYYDVKYLLQIKEMLTFAYGKPTVEHEQNPVFTYSEWLGKQVALKLVYDIEGGKHAVTFKSIKLAELLDEKHSKELKSKFSKF